MSRVAEMLRGNSPAGVLLATLIVLAVTYFFGPRLGAPLVVVWMLVSRVTWRDLGLARPASWARTIATGIIAGIACKLLMKAVVMRLLGAPDINPAYHYLAHNTAALPGMLAMVIFSAGVGEELVARGFMFDRLGRMLGRSRNALIATVLITSVLFGLAHLPGQQWPGATQAFILSLVVGTYFAIRRNLWTLIVWHAAFDICAVLLVYFDLETTVARSIFR